MTILSFKKYRNTITEAEDKDKTDDTKVSDEAKYSEARDKRGIMEVSGRSLSFLDKVLAVKKHLLSYDAAQKFYASCGVSISRPKSDDSAVTTHPEFKENLYVRTIDKKQRTKVLFGDIHRQIDEGKELPMSKKEEKVFGRDSTLGAEKRDYGKWNFDPGIHGPARAKQRQPDWSHDEWHDLVSRAHEAITDTSKHLSDPKKIKMGSMMAYSKRMQQAVIFRISPKNQQNMHLGGETRLETIPPYKHSRAEVGTQRVIIEGVEYIEGENLIIIE